MNNTNKIYQGEANNTEFDNNNIKQYPYNSIVIENIENSKGLIIKKDGITIVVGDVIDICNGEREIRVDKDFNIVVKGNINLQSSGKIVFKTSDGNLFYPNGLPNCLFTGSPHSFCKTIIGEINAE